MMNFTFIRRRRVRGAVAWLLACMTFASGTTARGATYVTAAGNNYLSTTNAGTEGAFIIAGSNLFFGSFASSTYTPNAGVTLGAGDITVLPGAAIQFQGTGNRFDALQTVEVRSNLAALGTLRLASDVSLASVGFRSGVGGLQMNPTTGAVSLMSSGLLALNTTYSQTLDLSKIGDGTWYLGSTQDNQGNNGSYTAATLGVGAGNTYRLGGGSARVTSAVAAASLTLTQANVLTGTAAVQIGAPVLLGTQAAVGNIILSQGQDYTGKTTIYAGSSLELRGSALATSAIDVYGTLALGGTFGSLQNTTMPVTLMPGSTLRFDNTLGVLDSSLTTRWRINSGNPSPLALNGSTLSLVGNSDASSQLGVGQLTITRGSAVTIARAAAGKTTTVNAAGLTRSAGDTLVISPGVAGQLGVDEVFTLTSAPTPTNGIVAPWMINGLEATFLTYGAGGFANLATAGYTAQPLATISSNITGGTQILDVTGTLTMNAGTSIDVWAMRLGASILQAGAAPFNGTQLVKLGSGGLLTTGTTVRSFVAGLQFGTVDGQREALIYNAGTSGVMFGDFTSGTGGKITADWITKFGPGTLQLDAPQTTFSGNIYVNGGTLNLRSSTVGGGQQAGNGSALSSGGGTIYLNSVGAALRLYSDYATSSTPVANGRTDVVTNYQNNVVIGQNVIAATIGVDRATTSGVATRTIALAGGLTFGGGSEPQTLTVESANSYGLQFNGTTTLNGRPMINNAGNVTLAGPVTGGGTLSKMGAGILYLSNLASSNSFSAGLNIYAGTVQTYAKGTNSSTYPGTGRVDDPFNNSYLGLSASSLGTGLVTLYGGTLGIFFDGSATTTLTEIAPLGNNVVVAGNAAINVNVVTSTVGGSYNRVQLGKLTVGPSTFTVSGGSAYALSFGSMYLHGNATLATTSAPLVIEGATSDFGGSARAASLGVASGTAFAVTKTGANDLYFNTTPSFGGGIVINQGTLRTGLSPSIDITKSSSAIYYPFNAAVNYGQGTIRLNNGGGVRLDSPATLGPGQQIVVSSSATAASSVRIYTDPTANFSMAFLQTAIANEGTGGVLGLEGTNTAGATVSYTGAINMALIGDGTWYLTATANSGSYNGALKPGAPATPGGLPAYRWTSNGQFSTTTANMFTGAARLISGGYATGTIAGSPASIYNTSNNYTGGTDMMRGNVTGQSAGASGSVFGTGNIDVYGTWNMYNAATMVIGSATTNATTVSFHPGSQIVFEPNTGTVNRNRWGDATAMAMNGSMTTIQSTSTTLIASETVGKLSFARGSNIVLRRTGGVTASAAIISSTGQLERIGKGTLVIQTTVATPATTPIIPNNLGNSTTNFQRLILADANQLPAPLFGTVNSGSGAPTGMAPAYLVNGSDATFVTYGPNGFQNLQANTAAPGTGIAAYSNIVGATFTTGLTDGLATVDVQAVSALGYDASVYALRTAFNITGTNTLAIQSDPTVNAYGGLLLAAAVTISPKLYFGDTAKTTPGEAIIYVGTTDAAATTPVAAPTAVTATISNTITAASVTKFGVGTLAISVAQTHTGGWTVNQGTLSVTNLAGLGAAQASNTVVLNASGLTFGASATTGTYASGPISAVDDSVITFSPGGNDRVATTAELTVLNTAPGVSAQDARLTFNTDRIRSYLTIPKLTLAPETVGGNSNAQIVVNTTLSTHTGISGMQSGIKVTNLVGTDANTTLRKWGYSTLYLTGDNSATFAGIISIEQGAVRVVDQNALGASTSKVKVLKNGVLDIGIAAFARTTGITYNAGSAERWSVDNARNGGAAAATLDLGKATLQIGADQTASTPGTLTVRMNGGSIEGYLANDDALTAVNRSVGAGITFELYGDSYLGQNVLQGNFGVDNGRGPTVTTPFANTVTGATLEILGPITGTGALTKISGDTVVLSGANTFAGGLNITAGVVRINNADDRLPIAGRLLTAAGGIFDLNGYNQQVGSLVSAHGFDGFLPVDGGFIYNSATSTSLLSVGTAAAVSYTYGGTILGNIGLVKNGGANNLLELLAANTYYGGTFLNGGILSAANETAFGAAGTALTFDGGALRLTDAAATLTRPISLQAGGGIFDVPDSLTVSGLISGPGGLTLQNGGTLHLSGNNAYLGTTQIRSGRLEVGVATGPGVGSGMVDLAGGLFLVSGGVTTGNLSFGTLQASGSGRLLVNSPSASTSVSFANLQRAGTGTLVIVPQTASFGLQENIGFTSMPTATGGILDPWIVVQTSGNNPAADFVTDAGGQLARAVYTGAGNLNAAAAGDVFNVTSASTLSGDRTVFALKTNQTISGAAVLTIGNGSGSAGLILNGGAVDVTTLEFGGAEGVVYVGATASIGAAINGSAGLTKFGPGTLLVSGKSTYTGTTSVHGGVLQIGRDDNLGAAGGLVQLDAATLQTLNTFTTLRNLQLLYGGGTLQVDALTTFTINGAVSGVGGIVKLGSGTLILNTINSYQGNTRLGGGKLSIAADDRLGGANALLMFAGGALRTTASFTTARAMMFESDGTFDVAGGTTLSVTAGATGAAGVLKTGGGTLNMAAKNSFLGSVTVRGGTLRLQAANQYTGGTTIDYGTLVAQAVGNSQSPLGNTATLTLNNGLLQLDGTNALSLTGVGGALFVTGGGTLLLNSQSQGNLALTFGSLARGGQGTLVIVPRSGNLNNALESTTLVAEFLGFTAPPTATSGMLAPWVVRQASAADSTGDYLGLTGTFVQTAVYSTSTNITTAGASAAFSASGTMTLTADASLYSLRTAASTTIAGANFTLTIGNGTQGGVILNGAAVNTKRLAFTTGEALVYAGGAQSSTISAIISGSGGLTKFGPQTLVLSGANEFTGLLSLNGGTLQAAVDGNLGDPTSTLNFNGGTLRAADTFTTSRNAQLNAGGGFIAVAATKELVFQGSFTGDSLTKTEAGKLTLTSLANNFTGGTTIVAGTLELSGGGILPGSGDVVVQNGATLVVGATSSVTAGGDVLLAGTATVAGGVGGAVYVQTGGLLQGSGTVAALDVAAGGTVSPGANAANESGVGMLSVSGTAENLWRGDSTLYFQFSTADTDLGLAGTQGTPGTNWDYLDVIGELAIAADSAHRIRIQIDSWLIDNSAHGEATNFDPSGTYAWKLASASQGITFQNGMDVFTFDASTADAGLFGSGNYYTPVGSNAFYISASGNDLFLNYGADYAAVPEPGSLLLVGLAFLAYEVRRRLRRRREAAAAAAAVALQAEAASLIPA